VCGLLSEGKTVWLLLKSQHPHVLFALSDEEADAEGVPNSDDDDHNDGEENADEHAGEDAENDHDAAADLDEAGGGMNDYKRGKRLKKLSKLLLSPLAQAPNTRLKWVSIVVMVLLVAVDLAMFFVFMQLSNKQSQQVQDLRSSSSAVDYVMRIAIATL
jgi:hypothetical protein